MEQPARPRRARLSGGFRRARRRSRRDRRARGPSKNGGCACLPEGHDLRDHGDDHGRAVRVDSSAVEQAIKAVVDNLDVVLRPSTRNIRRRGTQQGRVLAVVEGVNAGLLLSPAVVGFELRTPGADPIASMLEWPGDTVVDEDFDGVPELKICFDRRRVAALRAAVAVGAVDPDERVRLVLFAWTSDGDAARIGGDRIRIVVG